MTLFINLLIFYVFTFFRSEQYIFTGVVGEKIRSSIPCYRCFGIPLLKVSFQLILFFFFRNFSLLLKFNVLYSSLLLLVQAISVILINYVNTKFHSEPFPEHEAFTYIIISLHQILHCFIVYSFNHLFN